MNETEIIAIKSIVYAQGFIDTLDQFEVCGVKHRLQVHHLTYERLGNERDEDLKVLCWACHEREHGLR